MIEKINDHYSFTAPATIYDEEALTTLELAARTAAKVNECVAAFNEFESDVKNDVKTQNNHITEIDNLVKEFLGNGLPVEASRSYEVFSAIVRELVDEGKFAEIYDSFKTYVLALLNVERARIDNMLASTVAPDNGELIDLRIDYEGRTWIAAGEAIRNAMRVLADHLNAFTNPYTVTVVADTENEGALWQDAGQIRSGFGHTKCYKVNAGEHYVVSAYYGYSFPDVIFSNSKAAYENGLNIIAIGRVHSTGYASNNFDHVYRVPEGADEMWVQWADPDADISKIVAKRVEGYKLDLTDLEEFVDTALQPLESLTPSLALCTMVKYHEAHVLRQITDGTISSRIVSSGETSYKTATYKVEAGYRVKFKCCANYGNVLYYVHNSETGEIFKYELSENVAAKQTVERELVIPIGYDSVTLANVVDTPECYFVSGYKGASPLDGVSIITIGDSVTEHNDSATKNYVDYLSDNYGASIVNLAKSGAGFLSLKSDSKNYANQIISAGQLEPDVILIMGSGNDMKYMVGQLGQLDGTDTDTIHGQMSLVTSFIRSRYAGRVKFGFVAPLAWAAYPPNKDNVMGRYVDAMRDFCRANCVPFLDLYHESGLTPSDATLRMKYFDTNGVHPNADGHKFIAPIIADFVRRIAPLEV